MKHEIITIATVSYSRALLIQANLEAEGIFCFLANINQIQSGIGGGVNVKINEKDKQYADEIIKEIIQSVGVEKQVFVDAMKTSRRILVPVDFSQHSFNACIWAIQLAQKLKAEVKIIHVYFNPAITIPNFNEHYSFHLNLDKFINELVNNASYDLDNLMDKLDNYILKEKLDVKLSKEIIGGLASDVILEESKTYNPSMIIMGTKGKGKKEDYLVGSVTTELIEFAKVPVLIVPESAIIRPNVGLHNILYASNFDDSDFNSIGRLLNLMKPFDIKLHCVHIDSGKDDQWDSTKMKGLQDLIVHNYQHEPTSCSNILNTDVVEGVNNYAHANNIDVISLTTHKKNFITRRLKRSLSRETVMQAICPILIFHIP